MNLLKYVGIPLLLGTLAYVQNERLTVSRYVWSSPKLPSSFDGYRILQLSDLHQKTFGRGNRRLLMRVEKERPDLIAITGDVLFGYTPDIDKAIRAVAGLPKIAPTYFVSGNHEFKPDERMREELYRRLEEEGIFIHNNRLVRLSRGGEEIVLLGVDDPTCFVWKERRERFFRLLSDLVEGLGEEELKILLSHRPERFAFYEACGIDLTFSGHVHGGQIRLPLLKGLYSPEQGFFPKYQKGLYRSGTSFLVVSAGLGKSIIPLRINNYPDIVMVELRKGTKT
ncbi:MAG: metallophosphoesterase [Filifactor alocis]|nr:metallophosphoesterase [Filifactor alocis]